MSVCARLNLGLVIGALVLFALGCGRATNALAQSQDLSTAPIQGQSLAPPPNTDESKILGQGAAAGSAPAAGSGEIAPPQTPPAPEAAPPAASSTPASTDWIAKREADLIILDKIYGSARKVDATVGTPFTVRFLTITVLACWARPPTLPPDAAVFLQVTDAHAPGGSQPKFRGWIFEAEPSLSGLVDPATGVSVKACR
jgi:hypothetical protein